MDLFIISFILILKSTILPSFFSKELVRIGDARRGRWEDIIEQESTEQNRVERKVKRTGRGYVRAEQNRRGGDRAGQGRTGVDGTEQVERIEEDRRCQERERT